MRNGFLFLCLLLASASAQAQTKYYQCKDQWGQPVFSQRPCGTDATQSTVTAQEKISPSEGSKSNSHSDSASAGNEKTNSLVESESSWDKVTASRRLREAEREIERREDKIERLERERDTKIAKLDNSQRYANNNLAGAQYMESLATEMRAVNDQYGSKIDSEERKIDRLLDEAEKNRQVLE